MTGSSQPPLPDYELPPVIEVVCGAQFEPLEGFDAATFGLLWERFRSEYPTREQQPPLAQVIERFGEATLREPRVELSKTPPLPRMFFIHEDPCWLVQVQPDRFLHNWRKTSDADVYPRFPEVSSRFWSAWHRFLEFCRDEKIDAPAVNQLEVTYINHIVEGQGWDGLDAVGSVFPDIAWRSERSFLPRPESLLWKASFPLPDQAGRLHVAVRHAIRRQDSKPVLLCELTARGVPATADEDALREWLLLGREWIVRAFADLTGAGVQNNIWRRKV